MFLAMVGLVGVAVASSDGRADVHEVVGFGERPSHAVADVFGDGQAAVAWVLDGQLHLWSHGEGGMLASTVTGSTAAGFGGVAAVDVDGDGYDDLLCDGVGGLVVFRGGAGGPRPSGWAELPVWGPASPLGDVDGDGHGDVLIGSVVWHGSEMGLVVGETVDGLASPPRAFPLGDLDGDGYDDVGLARAGGVFGLHRGGPGGLRSGPEWSYGTGRGDCARDAVLADVDADGLQELVLACHEEVSASQDSVDYVVLSELLGVAPTVESVDPDGQILEDDYGYNDDTFYGLSAADVDGDGDDDLLLAYDREIIAASWSPDMRRFETHDDRRWSVSGVKRAFSVSTADVDGDGVLDLVGLFDEEPREGVAFESVVLGIWLEAATREAEPVADTGGDTGDAAPGGLDTGDAGVDTSEDATSTATEPVAPREGASETKGCGCRATVGASTWLWVPLWIAMMRGRRERGRF
jgi:hypothetical protein